MKSSLVRPCGIQRTAASHVLAPRCNWPAAPCSASRSPGAVAARRVSSPSHLISRSRQSWQLQASGMDVMPAWTLDQIAGLVFGMVMLLSVTSAKQVDVWVAKAQRKQLGLCEQCGGVNSPATCQQQGCPMKAPRQ